MAARQKKQADPDTPIAVRPFPVGTLTLFGPALPCGVVLLTRIFPNFPNLLDGLVQRGRHELMHRLRIVAFHKKWRPAAAAEKLVMLLMLDAGQNGRITARVSGVGDSEAETGPLATAWHQ
jgi:hypothetical protein